MKNKYNAQATEIDGFKFASKKEARRYTELLLLQRAGEIGCLECFPSFDIVINGQLICKYIADFAYDKFTDIGNGKHTREQVVEDVKGMKNSGAWRIFRIKQKLMKAVHGIEIQII